MTRLEAAARALWLLEGPCPYDELHPDEQADVMRDAKKVLDAAYPELTDGSHWIAPRIPTDAMLNAGCDLIDDPSSNAVDAVYTVMRNAYLKDKTE